MMEKYGTENEDSIYIVLDSSGEEIATGLSLVKANELKDKVKGSSIKIKDK